MPETTMFRFNSDKVPLSLVPESLARYTAFGLWYGSLKYARDNWRKAGSWSSVIDSMERHIAAFKNGEDIDQESGLPHLCLIGCNLAFLIEFFDTDRGNDDRFRYEDEVERKKLMFNEPPKRQLTVPSPVFGAHDPPLL